MKIPHRFVVLISIITLGFVTYGGWSFMTLHEWQVNGSRYQHIVQGKDLIADVLPPPEYIIESYLVNLQLLRAEDRKEQERLIEREKKLKDEYDARHEFWAKQGLSGELALALLQQSYQSAQTFYNVSLNEFIPAVIKGDKAAANALIPRLNQSYETHRAAIDKVTALARQRVLSDETTASKDILGANALSLLILFVSLLSAAAAAVLISRSIFFNLGGEPANLVEITEHIALGDLSVPIHLRPGDDISLLHALKTMRNELRGIVLEVELAVKNMGKGDFSHEIYLTDRIGFDRTICRALNELRAGLLLTIGGTPREVVSVAQAIAMGDLRVHIPLQPGDKDSILAAMAEMKASLLEMIDEVREVVRAFANGDFSYNVDVTARHGCSKTMAEMLNALDHMAFQGLSDISRVATAVAQGDLTQQVELEYPGLFGQSAQSINLTCKQLKLMMGRIVDIARTIDHSATEIATVNQERSQRSEQQADGLEKTASSMNELAATVRRNAESAQQASLLAIETSEVASKGGKVVAEVVKTMNSIQESSRKVSDIIAVIDGLAFQTNILALNAAVEAARAGEQGRGFAVVASEVRTLAQRSASAAREIKQLISDSVEKVDSGSLQVKDAGQTMDEIVLSVKRVTEIVSEISAASLEQSSGIDQVNKAVTQMDDIVMQNFALVQEAVTSAGHLKEQAAQLQEAIAVFQLQ
ncbi:methyl-accepting chemotaxis protein [Candidatus Methylospira mobilis]|nr:methyl-accepting chemotaxis protein [Candidatus Methylospira mobilis]